MNNITQSELKNILIYNPKNGEFRRKISTNRNNKPNQLVGSLRKNGYISIFIKNKSYLAHRLAWLYMTGEWPTDQIDHVNHIRKDNKWLNLRAATSNQNQRNKSLSKNNKSGFSGIYWCNKRSKWCAEIKLNNKKKHLGRFKNINDAIIARQMAEYKYGFHANHGI